MTDEDRISELLSILREAMPVIERAATEEARSNRAPTGLTPKTKAKRLYERAQAALKST